MSVCSWVRGRTGGTAQATGPTFRRNATTGEGVQTTAAWVFQQRARCGFRRCESHEEPVREKEQLYPTARKSSVRRPS